MSVLLLLLASLAVLSATEDMLFSEVKDVFNALLLLLLLSALVVLR